MASLLSSLHKCRLLPLGLGVFRLLWNGMQAVDKRKDLKSRSYRGQCNEYVQRPELNFQRGQTPKRNSKREFLPIDKPNHGRIPLMSALMNLTCCLT